MYYLYVDVQVPIYLPIYTFMYSMYLCKIRFVFIVANVFLESQIFGIHLSWPFGIFCGHMVCISLPILFVLLRKIS
jgi:hypothetical protein